MLLLVSGFLRSESIRRILSQWCTCLTVYVCRNGRKSWGKQHSRRHHLLLSAAKQYQPTKPYKVNGRKKGNFCPLNYIQVTRSQILISTHVDTLLTIVQPIQTYISIRILFLGSTLNKTTNHKEMHNTHLKLASPISSQRKRLSMSFLLFESINERPTSKIFHEPSVKSVNGTFERAMTRELYDIIWINSVIFSLVSKGLSID